MAIDDLRNAKPVPGGSLREYRTFKETRRDGLLRSGTANARGEMVKEVSAHDGRIAEAKKFIPEYDSAMATYNQNLGTYNDMAARIGSAPKSQQKGMMTSANIARYNMGEAQRNAEIAVRKITGGDAITRTIPGGYDPDGNPLPDKVITDLAASPTRDLSGAKAKAAADNYAALAKRDMARAPQSGGLLAPEAEETSSDSSAFAGTGNKAISSLTDYRRG